MSETLPFKPVPAPAVPPPDLVRLVAALAHLTAARVIRAGWTGADLAADVTGRATSPEQAVRVTVCVGRHEPDDPRAMARADLVRDLNDTQRAIYEASGPKELKRAALIRRAGKKVNSHTYTAVAKLLEWGLLSPGPKGGVYRTPDHAAR